MSTCRVCTQTLSQKSPGLQCVFCENFFHAKCVELTKTQLDTIKSTQNLLWKCTHCSKSADLNKYTGCPGCTKIPSLIETINKLTESVAELQRQINNGNNKSNLNSLPMEDVINEINERQSRANNILIFKLNEPESDVASEREEEDEIRAKQIIKLITPEVSTDNMKTVRLGKRCDQKVRALKISLKNRDDALKIIRNKNKLKNSEYNVIVSLDQTIMQRNYFKKIKAELDERIQKGEHLKIKYFNGVPQIVNQKN